MDPENLPEPPAETWRDTVQELAIQAANSVTFGVAGTMASKILQPEVARRRLEFDRAVWDAINKLQELGRITEERLREHNGFVSAYLRAMLAAVQTNNQDKRAALRNAVLNTSIQESPDESRQQVYIGLIDAYTPLHLQLLGLIYDPKAWYEVNSGSQAEFPDKWSLWEVLIDVRPELEQERDLINKILRDFRADGLMDKEHFYQSRLPEFMVGIGKSINQLGEGFLAFIADPLSLPE